MLKKILSAAIIFASACASVPKAETPVMHSSAERISLRIDGELRENAWRLAADVNPDIFAYPVRDGKSGNVCFVSDIEELCFTVGEGDKYDFIVLYNGVEHHTRVYGAVYSPAAKFSKDYQDANRGALNILTPEVYEMVSVAIALTPYMRNEDKNGAVATDSSYYKRMREYFKDVENHEFVSILNSYISANLFYHLVARTDAFAFEFDKNGKIRKSPIYDRTWDRSDDGANWLNPFQKEMQSFADASHFRRFYAREAETYKEQAQFFRQDADVAGLNAWLENNFPQVRAYDSLNIVFSPLTGTSQSSHWFESNGFRELQPHVNFPYKVDERFSKKTQALKRAAILFTEMNHAYINPTADPYAKEIEEAINNRAFWANDDKAAGSYNSDQSLFNEYMNWGLVALLYNDLAPPDEAKVLIEELNPTMEEGRGFIRFTEFNAFLLNAYRNRKNGETIADLYPAIIAWFARTDASAQ